MTTRSLLAVENLSFSYRQGDDWRGVLHGISFRIGAGEAFGLVGESGCGKSTVAFQLMGHRPPNGRIERGRVLFREVDVLRLDRRRLDQIRGNRVSFVPQNPATSLSPGMRVGTQISEVLLRHRVVAGRKEAQHRVAELFAMVGLPEPATIGRRYPHELSGGQQQRVAIAMAVACEPDLVVLDEPTTGLDVTTQEQIIKLLADLRSRLAMSMLYVTHDLGVLAQIADRVGVMYAGYMVETAPTAILFRRPRHPYTRGLIASVPRIEVAGSGGRLLRGLLHRDELPPGCAFQPRCDFVDAGCALGPIPLERVAEGHSVACCRWREIDEPASAPVGRTAPRRRQPTDRPVLVLDGVTLSYRGQQGRLTRWLAGQAPAVVHDLSFSIAAGEVVALVGESGSGKSTVARAISGLIEPLAGRIQLEGEDLSGSIRRRSKETLRRIQFIFQNPDASLNPRARVRRTLARPLELFFDLGRSAVEQRVRRALDDTRLDAGYADRFPDQLSGGERQRVAIARALVANPVLLLCDEILSALDVSVQASIIDLLQRLRGEHDLAMLFISHDLAVVRSLADRVAVLFRGRLMEIGATEDVFRPPFHPYTHALLMAVPGMRPMVAPSWPRPQQPAATTADGCAFAGRCPWQPDRRCAERAPPWRTTATGVRLRCHLPLDELAVRAVWGRGAPEAASQETIRAMRRSGLPT